MTGAGWDRVKEVFQAALEHRAEDREAFVRQACGGDTRLRQEVTSLLEAQGEAGGFLKALSLSEELAAANPEDTLPRTDVATLLRHVGDAELALGRPAAAVESLKRALAMQEERTRADPDDGAARTLLAEIRESHAKALACLGGNCGSRPRASRSSTR